MVDTVPAEMSIRRIRWLYVSATRIAGLQALGDADAILTPQSRYTAIPAGKLKRAEVRGPSANPSRPGDPARVVTAPVVASIPRMTWLSLSATYTVPISSTATP